MDWYNDIYSNLLSQTSFYVSAIIGLMWEHTSAFDSHQTKFYHSLMALFHSECSVLSEHSCFNVNGTFNYICEYNGKKKDLKNHMNVQLLPISAFQMNYFEWIIKEDSLSVISYSNSFAIDRVEMSQHPHHHHHCRPCCSRRSLNPIFVCVDPI